MAKKAKKIFVGLSGGVDSSVAAALLIEQGYDVVPVFLKCWEDPLNVERGTPGTSLPGDCPWQEDQEAAYAVCEKLGITSRFQSWNFTEEFMETVVQYLVDEARLGRTGNPDVICNRTVKFGAFLERALAEGADAVATGHYARRSEARSREGRRVFQLLRPNCETKNDQTYFLWQLKQEQLLNALFPIGDFASKDAVREEARRRGLPSAERRSTRGICFVGKEIGYAGFLQRFLPKEQGAVVTTAGRVVGQHEGLAFYTLGQRQGIGISDAHGPYYVVEKDEERNTLVVAPPAEQYRLWQRDIVVRDANWISGAAPVMPLTCSAFVRHPQDTTVLCTVSRSGDRLQVQFAEPQYAPTPGQSVVFYDGDVVLGGAVIQ